MGKHPDRSPARRPTAVAAVETTTKVSQIQRGPDLYLQGKDFHPGFVLGTQTSAKRGWGGQIGTSDGQGWGMKGDVPLSACRDGSRDNSRVKVKI